MAAYPFNETMMRIAPMANDRYRYDQDRSRGRDDAGGNEDDGYIARRGFGNARSGYSDRGREPVLGGQGGQDRNASRSLEDRGGSSYFGRGSRDYQEDWTGGASFEENVGDHRGRGPKGYQRSDVNDRLTDDPHIDASEVDVAVANREVTLTGTVNSRFEKRHVEDIAESVLGVAHVQNNLRVQQYADMGMGGSMLSGVGAAGAGTTGDPGIPSDKAGQRPKTTRSR
jgi:hypothetical protein